MHKNKTLPFRGSNTIGRMSKARLAELEVEA